MIIVGPYPISKKIVGGTAFAVKSLIDLSLKSGLSCSLVNTSLSSYSRAPLYLLLVAFIKRTTVLLNALSRVRSSPVLIFVSSGYGVFEKLVYSFISKVVFRRRVFVFIRSGNFCIIHSSGLLRCLAISLFKFSDCVLIQSRFYRSLFVSSFNLSSHSIVVFPNWLPSINSLEDCFNSLDLTCGVVRFVACGNLLAYKRHDQTLKLFKRLSSALSDLNFSSELVVLGDGPEIDNLRLLVSDLGLLESVKFLGHIDQQHILSVFKSSWFYISLSPFEGFSNSLLQAMSCGVVPIVHLVGGVPELVIDTGFGFLADSSNVDSFDVKHITALVQDTHTYRALRSSLVKSISKNYSPKRAVDLYDVVEDFNSL